MHKKWKIGLCIFFGVATFIGSVMALIFFLIRWWKKSLSNNNADADVEQQQLSLSIRTTSDKKISFDGSQYTSVEKPENYTFEDLQKATHHFSSSNLIQGSVYHGRLKGKNLAIKRVASQEAAKVETETFRSELNVVRMLGACVLDGPDSFLVLEYAANGSLKDWIHGGLAIKSHFIASCNCFLSWNQRLKICLDVATALQQMHEVMSPSYVHGSITSRNVYLDEDFRAKVGIPRSSDKKEEGYLAPEYISHGTISTSMDIFAYGIVLLEVLSGKPPATCREMKGVVERGEVRRMVDSGLGENYSLDGAVLLANVAKCCVEEDPCCRPSAGEIVDKLLVLVEDLSMPNEFNVCESSCTPLVI